MATAPLSVPAGISADPEAQQEYVDALNKQLAALENRAGTNWFNIAAAFADPGRTGSFGESFGKAMGVVGKQQEEEQARALPVAQMRAQLAGQKYQLSQDAKSQEMIAGALGGMSLQDVAQALSTPQGAIANPMIMQRLASVQAQIPPGSKYAEQVKNLIDTQNKMLEFGLKSGQLTNDQIKTYYETGYGNPPGASPSATAVSGKPAEGIMPIKDLATSLMTDFGLKPEQLSLERTRAQQDDLVKRHAAGEKGIYTPAKTVEGKEIYHEGAIDVPTSVPPSYMEARGYVRPDPKNDPVHWVPRSASLSVPASSPAGQATTTGAQTPKGREQVEIQKSESEQKIRQQAAEKENEPWTDKTKEILKYDNYATKQNLARTDQIQKLVSLNPNIVGLLQNADQESLNSWLQAIGMAAQEGIKIGNMGSVSIPVEKFFATAKLTKDQKLALGELSRHLANEFFAGMKSNRGLLGVNPTDNDARLYQATMAGTGNLAENIYSWAQTKAAEYETMNQMYKGYVDHRKKFGTTDPASFYTVETSPYHSAVDWYGNKINTIYSQAPGVSGVQ